MAIHPLRDNNVVACAHTSCLNSKALPSHLEVKLDIGHRDITHKHRVGLAVEKNPACSRTVGLRVSSTLVVVAQQHTPLCRVATGPPRPSR